MAARKGGPGKKVNSTVIRAVRGQGQGMGFTKNHSEIMILLRDRGQVGRCSSGTELWRPRRLGGAQTVGETVGTPRNDLFGYPVNLRIVGLKPGVA